MPRLDDLPPDLRATLSLLVDRGKSYAEVAELLGISEDTVRDRAHTALDRLAGGPAFSSQAQPEYSPAHPSPVSLPSPPSSSPSPSQSTSSSGSQPPSRAMKRPSTTASTLPVSRRGGAVLLSAIAVVIVIVVILLTTGGGGSSTSTNTSAGPAVSTSRGTATNTTSSSSTKSNSGKTPAVTNQLTLAPSEPGSKAIGLVEVLAEGSKYAIIVAAEHLAPSSGFYYLVWLYNSPTSATPVGRAPTVGSNGRLQGGALLPSNAGEYHHILITRETNQHPTTPGPTVLSGAFSLT
jgi:hypothetical protein